MLIIPVDFFTILLKLLNTFQQHLSFVMCATLAQKEAKAEETIVTYNSITLAIRQIVFE